MTIEYFDLQVNKYMCATQKPLFSEFQYQIFQKNANNYKFWWGVSQYNQFNLKFKA